MMAPGSVQRAGSTEVSAAMLRSAAAAVIAALLSLLVAVPAGASWRDQAMEVVRRSTDIVREKHLALLDRPGAVSRYTVWYAADEHRLYRLDGDAERLEHVIAVCDAIAERVLGDDEALQRAQAIQLQSAVMELVQIRRGLVEAGAVSDEWLGRFDRALAAATDQIIAHVPERETMNRASYGGASCQAMLAEFPEHPHAEAWRNYADAVWGDWTTHRDTIEDGAGYNALWLLTMLVMADERGEPLAPPDELRALLERWAVQVTPAGTMPDYGDTYFHVPTALWCALFARAATVLEDGRYERLARELFEYRRSQFAGQIAEDPSHMHWLAWACTEPGPEEAEPELRSTVTRRVDRYGWTLFDKLILRDARPHRGEWPASFAMVNLHDMGYHGHADAGAVVSLVRGDTVHLHELGYHADQDRYHNSLLVLPHEAPFPEREREFMAGSWNHAVLDLRRPFTYTGRSAPDLSRIDALFFRIDDEDATNLEGELRFREVRLAGPDGATLLEELVGEPGQWSNAERLEEQDGPAEWRSAIAFTDDTSSERHWVTWQLSRPVDLGAFERIELMWSLSDNRLDRQIGVQFGLQEGEHTQRWRIAAYPAHREVTACELLDLERAAHARIELRVADRGGAAHRQLRQVALLKPRGALIVRDTLFPEGSGVRQVGQVWHVEEIADRGDDWFIARSEVMYPDRDVVWRTEPGEMLLRFFPRPGHEVGSADHALVDRGREIAQRWAVYDRWSGQLNMHFPRSFTCLLWPLEGEVPDCEMLWEDGERCLLRIGEDLVLLNPGGERVEGRIGGDASFCWAEMEHRRLAHCTAQAGELSVDGAEIKPAGERGAVEFEGGRG